VTPASYLQPKTPGVLNPSTDTSLVLHVWQGEPGATLVGRIPSCGYPNCLAKAGPTVFNSPRFHRPITLSLRRSTRTNEICDSSDQTPTILRGHNESIGRDRLQQPVTYTRLTKIPSFTSARTGDTKMETRLSALSESDRLEPVAIKVDHSSRTKYEVQLWSTRHDHACGCANSGGWSDLSASVTKVLL
jgi:hypothetical protein